MPASRASASPPSRTRAFPPPGSIARFSDHVVANDLPALPADRRAETVAFAGRRIAMLPSPIKLGVGATAILVDGLGSRFEILGASIKKWPAGAPIQAALDALQTLVRTHGLGAEDVADLTVRLPDDRIAQHPAPRGESRLLVLDAEGDERHRRVRDLPEVLQTGDLLVVNDTRVLPARLLGRRAATGAR